MQCNLAYSFSPLKTAALSHGELQQQEDRVSFNSSFGIKEVSRDSSFSHCMQDKNNQSILLLTLELWMQLDPQFHSSDVSFSNISVLKKADLFPVHTSDPELKNTTTTNQKVMLHSEHKQIKHTNHNVSPPAISLGVVFFWHVSKA